MKKLFLAALLCIGCGRPPNEVVHGDERLTVVSEQRIGHAPSSSFNVVFVKDKETGKEYMFVVKYGGTVNVMEISK